MAAHRSYIGDTHDRLESNLTLDAEAVIHDVGDLPIALEAGGCGWEGIRVAQGRVYGTDIREFDVGIELDGNILENISEEVVSFTEVVEHAETSTNDGLTVTTRILGEAKPRCSFNVTAASQSRRIMSI